MCRQMYMQKLQKHQYLDCSKIQIIYFTNNVQVTLTSYSTLFRKNTTCQSPWVNFSNSFLKIYFLSSEKEITTALLKRCLQNVDETDTVSLPTTSQENVFYSECWFSANIFDHTFPSYKGRKIEQFNQFLTAKSSSKSRQNCIAATLHDILFLFHFREKNIYLPLQFRFVFMKWPVKLYSEQNLQKSQKNSLVSSYPRK